MQKKKKKKNENIFAEDESIEILEILDLNENL